MIDVFTAKSIFCDTFLCIVYFSATEVTKFKDRVLGECLAL